MTRKSNFSTCDYKVISEQRAKNLETSSVGLVSIDMGMDMKIIVENKGLGHNQKFLMVYRIFTGIECRKR